MSDYVTAEQAETYFDGDPRAEAFLAEDMTWYLARATKIIDSLPLQGRKYLTDGSQLLQFPRQYREGYDMDELTGVAEVPQAVLDACCEEALAIFLAGTGTDRQALQDQGVASYQIPGIISETFRPGVTNARYGLRSPDAYRLLSRYIARSVPIV